MACFWLYCTFTLLTKDKAKISTGQLILRYLSSSHSAFKDIPELFSRKYSLPIFHQHELPTIGKSSSQRL